MFCEKCGTQIPDGGDNLCPRCRAAEAPVQPVQPVPQPVQTQIPQPVQSVPQPVQPQSQQTVQPQYQQPAQPQFQQPMMQQPMANVGGVNGILANPMIVMIIKLVLGAISLWAAFGPLLKLISYGTESSFISFKLDMSFMDFNNMAGIMGGSQELVGYFVPLLILMIFSILLALAGIALTVLPKVAPNVKLPLPSFASVGATALSLVCSIIGIFITIGFVAPSDGLASLSGFGVFMMILSFLALAGTVFLSYVELKKK